jgi:hypothetical protein
MIRSWIIASLGLLALTVATQAAPPAVFVTPRQPPPLAHPKFNNLTKLDEVGCGLLGLLTGSAEFSRNAQQLARKGYYLSAIAETNIVSNTEGALLFSYIKAGSPLVPPPPGPTPTAVFRVSLFLPQDAGWQVGEVGHIAYSH